MTAHNEREFVYGTLRRGGSNHFRMDGAGFIGFGSVCGRMYRFGWYPGLVADEKGDQIRGEVYEVNLKQLADLDWFEGLSAGEIEGSEYRRVRVTVDLGGSSLTAFVWEWLGAVEEEQRIKSGDWLTIEDE